MTEKTRKLVGLRVRDMVNKISGTITLEYCGQFEVLWENGMSGSFGSWDTFISAGCEQYETEMASPNCVDRK